MPSIEDFARQELQKGCSRAQLRQYLVSYGCPSDEAERILAGIEDARPGRFRRAFASTDMTLFGRRRLIAILAPIILLMLSVFFIGMRGCGRDSAACSISISTDRSVYSPDEAVEALVSFSEGDCVVLSSGLPVEYRLVGSDSKSAALAGNIQPGFQSGSSLSASIPLEGVFPGSYELMVGLPTRKGRIYSYAELTVRQEGELPDGDASAVGSAEDSDPGPTPEEPTSAADFPEDGSGYIGEGAGIGDGAGYINAESGDYLNSQAMALQAGVDGAGSMSHCSGLDGWQKDACISGLASRTLNKSLCREIAALQVKDACYANIALSGDFSACDYIQDSYQRRACEILEKSSSG